MSARATQIGPWEKFMLVPDKGRPNQVRLQSLATNRYVQLRPINGSTAALVASADTLEQATPFVRDGDDSDASLRVQSGKYVSAPPPAPDPLPMTAEADMVGSRERFALQPTLP
jgi:hypothetical protein